MCEMTNQARSQAWREAKVLRSLSHVNVVAHVATFMQNSRLNIVMEYADGGDLADAIKRRKLSSGRFCRSEVMNIFAQCCLGLEHTHAKHVLHRDLKSQNIFLTKAGVVKLGDFGIAKVLDHTTAKAESRVGTPYYVSPEVCDGRPYNLKADIWSLGVVLYELAALEPPFKANNLVTLVLRILQSEPRPLSSEFGEDMQDIVSRALQKSPADRPTCGELLALPALRLAVAQLAPACTTRAPPPPLLEVGDFGGLPELQGSPQGETSRATLRDFGTRLQTGLCDLKPRALEALEEMRVDPSEAVDELLESLEKRHAEDARRRRCNQGVRPGATSRVLATKRTSRPSVNKPHAPSADSGPPSTGQQQQQLSVLHQVASEAHLGQKEQEMQAHHQSLGLACRGSLSSDTVGLLYSQFSSLLRISVPRPPQIQPPVAPSSEHPCGPVPQLRLSAAAEASPPPPVSDGAAPATAPQRAPRGDAEPRPPQDKEQSSEETLNLDSLFHQAAEVLQQRPPPAAGAEEAARGPAAAQERQGHPAKSPQQPSPPLAPSRSPLRSPASAGLCSGRWPATPALAKVHDEAMVDAKPEVPGQTARATATGFSSLATAVRLVLGGTSPLASPKQGLPTGSPVVHAGLARANSLAGGLAASASSVEVGTC